jgi:glycosyltransferase involved in cell wall biosynthesis
MTNRPLISIVTPFYNEGDGVWIFFESIRSVIDSLAGFEFEVICIDDGSRDGTLALLLQLPPLDVRFSVLELTRNFGKESAMSAGLDIVQGDAVVILDADLQDPPELIGAMLNRWQSGADVVLGRRNDRSVDSVLKRKTAEWFYRLHNRMSDIQIPENVGDFRLMDRKVVHALKQLPEQQRFMKGLFAWVGFKTEILDYKRLERVAGDTKFSGWKLWNFALEGITSFSTAPLRIWTYVGIAGALCTLLYAIFIVGRTLVSGIDVPGYASLLVAILFIGSLQLISLGILGEYIGRIYLESKRRPTYLLRAIHDARTHGADKT